MTPLVQTLEASNTLIVPKRTKSRQVESDPKKVVRLYRSQGRQFKELVAADQRILIGPTGSGKGMTIRALAAHDTLRPFKQSKRFQRYFKAIISYSQNAIAPGYEPVKAFNIKGPDGKPLTFAFAARADEGTVAKLVDFIRTPAAGDKPGRVMLCTHAALVRAASIVQDDKKAWHGLSLFIDEAHHSQYNDPDDTNKLGALVHHYVTKKPGPITLATATWMRTNDHIVQVDDLPRFKKSIQHIDEYLEESGIEEIKIKFRIGPMMDALKTIIAENPHRKTIAYLPTDKESVTEKLGILAAAERKLRPFGLNTCDLITEEGREEVKAALFESVQVQKNAKREGLPIPDALPDLTWALHMVKEGADLPEVSRIIQMAPRGSLLDTLQMLGRALRSWPNKQSVEFNIIIPTGKGQKTEPEKVEKYLTVMVACLLSDWQFKRVSLITKTKRPKAVQDATLSVLANPDLLHNISRIRTEEAINNNGDSKQAEQQIWDRVSKLKTTHPELVRPEVVTATLEEMDARDKLIARRILREAKEIPFQITLSANEAFGPVRLMAAVFGLLTLRQCRQALGRGVRYDDSLAVTHPEIAAMWHPTKNGVRTE